MNVLVYAGPEILPSISSSTLSTLRSLLHSTYSVQSLSSEALVNEPWKQGCALLVLPRCTQQLETRKAELVRDYVEGGGNLLGLGMGAVLAKRSKMRTVSIGTEENLLMELWDSKKGRYVYPTYGTGEKKEKLRLKDDGGAEFDVEGVPDAFKDLQDSDVDALGTFIAPENEATAGIKLSVSKGTAAFWATPAEDSASTLPILRKTLTSLSLHVPSTTSEAASPASVSDTSPHSKAVPNPPTHPLPQFLLASNPSYVSDIISSLASPLKIPPAQLSTFTDDHDDFLFYPQNEGARLVTQSREEKPEPKRDSGNEEENREKNIILYADGLPPPEETPLFDFKSYFATLAKYRSAFGCSNSHDTSDEKWGIGEALLYGEVVTSTQTMLDKNPRFHTHLPTPILSLASYQLSGRGRGSNVWISPSGCLQFSLLLRVSLSTFPASKLVFVQYLFALAVAEACREPGILGKEAGGRVRLKWPNDIYAVVDTGEVDEDGRKKEERKKIGGILVGTSFGKGNVDVIIGCGLNVNTVAPIFSLAQLLSVDSLSMETTAACILTKFESMWTRFVAARGSFDEFMNLYLERWLHSDEPITITSITPHQHVRIAGITRDHGLLRTVVEHHGWGLGKDQFIDLQPDGNSFDMMKGLIGVKR